MHLPNVPIGQLDVVYFDRPIVLALMYIPAANQNESNVKISNIKEINTE